MLYHIWFQVLVMSVLVRNLSAIFVVIPLASCISTISSYDETTDASATQLQKDIDTFLVKMSSSPSLRDRYFSTNQSFYEKAAVDLDSLAIRTQSIPRNDLTVEQVGIIKQHLAEMALGHKGCLKAPWKEEQREAIRTKGVDASLGCRIEYGASLEVADRGQSAFNPVLAPEIKRQFDEAFGALLKLELEKKKLAGGES